jgi:hypothetical protein
MRSWKVKDLTGRRFGRLFVFKFLEIRGRYSYWVCFCDCGEIAVVRGVSLSEGNTKGCGCTNWRHGHNRKWRKTPTYTTWQKMKERCFNPSHEHFKYYGEKGITVCKEWIDDFRNFLKDMGERPSGTTIDRYPNNNGNYEPGNCRWADKQTQRRNQRRVV